MRTIKGKKDEQHLNCYVGRELCERLKAYADDKGQTLTTALERILKKYFEEVENNSKVKKLIEN